jgi:hypothetical protein
LYARLATSVIHNDKYVAIGDETGTGLLVNDPPGILVGSEFRRSRLKAAGVLYFTREGIGSNCKYSVHSEAVFRIGLRHNRRRGAAGRY